MKKIFSIVLGLCVGLVLCLMVGHVIKGDSSRVVSDTSSHLSGSKRFGSGMNFSGANRQFSGMNAHGSGNFLRNNSGNIMKGSGVRPGMGFTGEKSPEQLIDQGLLNK